MYACTLRIARKRADERLAIEDVSASDSRTGQAGGGLGVSDGGVVGMFGRLERRKGRWMNTNGTAVNTAATKDVDSPLKNLRWLPRRDHVVGDDALLGGERLPTLESGGTRWHGSQMDDRRARLADAGAFHIALRVAGEQRFVGRVWAAARDPVGKPPR